MRLPFFKSTKADMEAPPKVLATPPRFAGVTAKPQPPRPATATTNPEAENATLTLYLASLLDQLPAQLFVAQPPQPLDSVTFDLPVSLVLPRLRTGRLDIPLSELLRHVPSECLRQPLPHFHESQTVALPLAEVIEALPPELLLLTHESEIKADDPELDQLPKLIDDALLQEPPAAAPVTEATAAPASKPALAAPTIVSAPTPAPTLRPSDIPEHVVIRLRSLVTTLPDNVLSCARADLPQRANLESPVLLPVEPMLPQLKSGSIRLPVSVVLALIPITLRSNPMPSTENQMVSLPLAEIVPQLPPRLFTEHLRDPQPQNFETVETNFPDPFRERSAPEPQPVSPPVQEQLEAEPCFSDAALTDEDLTVFAEKRPAPPLPAPQAEPVDGPVAVPEPVAEATPAPVEAAAEPVAEVPPAPIEPEVVAPPVAEAEAAMAPAASEPTEGTEPAAETAEPFDAQKYLVNLNRCTEEDLILIEGIGPALARRIIDFREVHGQFNSIEEIRQVPGVGRKTFRALAGAQPRALNRLLGAAHNNELTLQEIVALTGKLPGVDGCMLALADGLFLAGQLPAHLDQDTVSVFAPQLFKKVGRYARELKLGQIQRFTIFTDTQPISIFRAGEVYLIVVHDTVHFSKALLRRCERISKELARLCRQRVVV